MIKNKKLLFHVFLLFFGKVFSSETLSDQEQQDQIKNENSSSMIKDSNKYISVGIGFPGLPSLECGYRLQCDHEGMNTSIQVGTFFIFYQYLKAELSYLYFPHPEQKSQLYYGAGLGAAVGSNMFACFGSGQHVYFEIFPEFILGRQYKTQSGKKRFVQGQLYFPNLWLGKNMRADGGVFIPQFAVSYGIMF